MKTTLNQVHEELKYIAECHNQINSFFWGDFLRAFKENVLNYPLMCCYITPSITFNKVISNVPINIVLCDKIFKDWNENLDDVESDMLDLCNQVYQIIRSAGRWQDMGVVVSASVPQKFLSQGGDEVCGYQMTINFKFKNEVCYENLPLTGYDFGGGVIPDPPACLPAIFQNSDTTYEKSIPSGGTFISEDIEILLADGSQTFPSNLDIDLSSYAPVEPATVRNSDDTFEVLVNPGDMEILPDIEVLLGDGPQTFPSVKDLDLSNYMQLQKLPSGTYIPKNIVVGAFDLSWENRSANVTTGSGSILSTVNSGFAEGATFKINHLGDFILNFKFTNDNLIAGICYFKDNGITFNTYYGIDHSLLLQEGSSYVFGNGQTHFQSSGSTSDKFTISRSGLILEYKVNDITIYTQTLNFVSGFMFNCSMGTVGTINNLEVIIP